MTQTHHVNRVIHQLVDFGPLESRLPAVPHDFGVGSCDTTHLNGQKMVNIVYHDSDITAQSSKNTIITQRFTLEKKHNFIQISTV